MNRRRIMACITAAFLLAGSIPPVQLHAEDIPACENSVKKGSGTAPTQGAAELVPH